MSENNTVAVLADSFSALRKEELENLKFHLKAKTPIFCGAGAQDYYVNADLEFWPAVLASTREVDELQNKIKEADDRNDPEWSDEGDVFDCEEENLSTFFWGPVREDASSAVVRMGNVSRNTVPHKGNYLRALQGACVDEVRAAMKEATKDLD